MTKPTLTDLNPDEYSQGLDQYPFVANSNRCYGIYNTIDDPSGKICLQNKTENVNISVFNVITRTNE